MGALFSLIYISRSRLDPAAADEAIDAIVATSIAHNEQADITGALIYSGSHFAQVLEGGEPAVRELMARIERDPRHEHVTTIDSRTVSARRFGDWRMAYSGTATFMQKHIEALLPFEAAASRRDAIEQLYRLMRELAAAGGIRQR
jgi:hypothetical protein